ncbi:unnamed protein product, partial [Mesorhabditis spiculigera]
MAKFKALLLDIEGTITSISFVKDELFPYAYKNVENFLTQHFDEQPVQDCIREMVTVSKELSAADSEVKEVRQNSQAETVADLVHNVRHWIDVDKKVTPMKTLQGLIWEDAYKSGAVKGHLYPDVVPVLEEVQKSGRRIYIYSSGSVHAQKLLFQNSVNGDITKLLSGYFDTHVGLKGEATSYQKISEEIGTPAADILFLTDVEAEAQAARSAGCQTRLVVRPGNAQLSEEARKNYDVIKSLDEIRTL